MLTDWELAEKQVKVLTGGRFTPASGAKKEKGDVKAEGYMLEVKQTSKKLLNFQHLWLEKLERYKNQFDLAIVIFFELRGYVYYYQGVAEGSDWSTRSLKEEELPDQILSKNGLWVLEPISTLSQLKDG